MSRKLFIILLVAVALVAAASVYADQAAERNALSAAKEKPENVKTDIWAAGNIYFGNPHVDQRAMLNEGFEGGAIPATWTVHNVDGGDQWVAYNASAETPPYPGAHSGSYVARAYYDVPNNDWLVTPKLVCDAGTADALTFWASSYSSYFSEDFEVWVSTTGNQVADFTDMVYDSLQIPQGWEQHTVPLDDYDGQNIYVAIRCISNNEFALYIDDVTGPELWVPAGPAIAFNTSDLSFGTVPVGTKGSKDLDLVIYSVGASDLTVSSVSSDNAHFTHNFPGSTAIPAGDSLVVTVTFTPTAEPEETGTLTVTHDGTKADSYITMSGSGIDALFYEDFAAGIVPPGGWAGYELGDPAGWVTGTPGYDDDYCAFHDDNDVTTGCDDWLVTPQISLPAKAVYQMEFMQYQNYSTYYEYHGIMISTLSGDPIDGDFVELAEVGAGTEDTWEAKEFSLAAYAGEDIYLAFRYTGDYADEWSVDNVAVTEYVYVNEPPVIVHDPKGDTDDTTPTLTAIITDVETFTATAYYETAKMAFTPVAMTLTGVLPNEYSCDLPVGTYGTVNYYIEAEDDSKGLVATTDTYAFDICPLVGMEMIYDDGSTENATCWLAGSEANRFAVRFTPLAYPCTLNVVKLGIDTEWPDVAHQPFIVEIYDDDGAAGAPGTMLYGPDTTGSIGNVIGGLPTSPTPPYALVWALVCLKEEVIITDGDFYVAKGQASVNPQCEGLDIDDTGTQYSRSWQLSGGVWSEYYSGTRNLMIRAYASQVIAYGDLEGTVSEAKGPIVGATVTAVGIVTKSDITDGSGHYLIEDLNAGDYDVTATALGYYPETVTDVTITGGATTVQNFSLGDDPAILRESFCGTWLPAGWAEYNLGACDNDWEQDAPGYDDDCAAWHYYDCGDTCDGWLVTPQISIPLGGAQLDWMEYADYAADMVYHGIWVSTSTNDPGDFVELVSLTAPPEDTWGAAATVDLGAYEGMDIYVAFVYRGYCADDWGVDDVVIMPSGPPPELSLSDGSVNPTIGSLSTTFNYSVTYTQINDVPPTVKNVVIDGSPYAMTDPTAGSGPYAGGVVFTYAHQFDLGGNHEFYFYFEDGTNTARLPETDPDTFWGPMNGYYFWDFEDAAHFTPTGPTDDWQWGVPTVGPASAHSGEKCWGTVLAGSYSTLSQSRLETPSLDFTTGGDVHLELKFWHWYESEGSYTPYDGGNVKLITPTETVIIYPDLAQADDYDTYSMSTSNAWIPGEAAYFGLASGWKEAIFDLTPWTDESDVKIVFDFGSDGSTNWDGWYIDDVVIWGEPPLPVELAGFTAVAGDQMVTLSWETRSELNNLGFEMYRRAAEGEFEKITAERIPGAGNSDATQTYGYVDRGLTNGTTYSYQLAAVDFGGNVRMHDVLVSATPTASLPTSFAVSQNYPNPFNPNTEIKYQIPEDSRVVLKIYNVTGQAVVTLMDQDVKAGYYTATWNARDAGGQEVSAGIYFCTMKAGEFSQTVKMVLLR